VRLRLERVTSLEACDLCRGLAAQIWGEGAACSMPQMIVHAQYGGIILLAYDERNPVGFLFSFPALYKGETVLWSHETGVIPDYLHHGIGDQLKRKQRALAAEMGYRHIAWTYDPLIARNAYFNLVKLGATVDDYKINAYGTDASDLINQGIESDRFIAIWPVTPTPQATLATAAAPTPVMTSAIPHDFTTLLTHQPETAKELRMVFRETALRAFAEGLRPTIFRRTENGGTYGWTNDEASI
jgi:predicted GNAT superfamily acetyltransferase